MAVPVVRLLSRWLLLSVCLLPISAFSDDTSGLDAGRCNCEILLGPCEGSAQFDAHWLTVGSSSQRCSLVEIYKAGEKHASLKVTDGRSRHPWLESGLSDIGVGRCHICADADFADPAALQSEGWFPRQDREKLASDLSWLEGSWCWDWYGRPGKNTYRHVEDAVFDWGKDMQHTVSMEGDIMTVVDSMGATYERQVLDSRTMIWTKRSFRLHSADENVRMWRCD